MFELNDKLPEYLLGKYQLTATVVFTAFFSLVALLLCAPFSGNAWLALNTTSAFGYTLAFCCIVLLALISSKRLMYIMSKSVTMTYLGYIVWNLTELFVISAIYTLFTFFGDKRGIIELDDISVAEVFINAFLYSIVSFGVPYLTAAMYFAIQDKDNTIRMINFSEVVSDEPVLPEKESKITLFDNNGILKLSISSSNLYYIESDDNYIKVWYTDNSGLMKQYMLRCRLKTVEDSFQNSDLVRCHRKYIVNIQHVKVLSKEKDGYALLLDMEGTAPIFVSKTYEERVLQRFNSK